MKETIEKLDALSAETKRWLRSACNQIAEIGEYTPNDTARAECERAGLVTLQEDGSMEVDEAVMSLVYSNGYLDKS